MPAELRTIIDFIRWGVSRFNEAGLVYGHGNDSALDEATQLVLHALYLPHDLPPAYGQARLTQEESAKVVELLTRRVAERLPAAYLTGEAWFAGLSFQVDERVLVPRSPIAELIQNHFEPWLGEREVFNALDLCTGSGCIGIAMAAHHPGWRVDVTDISPGALELASANVEAHGLGDRVRVIESDLFDALAGEQYDLIVSNPPYVPDAVVDALPEEFQHEPALGLRAGVDGLDLVLRMLEQAPEFLTEQGLLIVEVGESQQALEDLLPELPLTWIEFKAGALGVFLIERDDLLAARADIARARRARGA